MTTEAANRGLSKRFLTVVGVGLILLVGIGVIVVRLNRKIAGEKAAIAESARVEVEIRPLRSPSTDGLTTYLNTADARAAAVFGGARYLATSGGLVKLDAGGAPSARFTTLDGLPDNDLTCLAVFRDKLFVGTSNAGLISFDGTGFTGYRFLKPNATRISVLLATGDELLVGTMDGGLFEFDGERFSRRYNSTSGADFNTVTALLAPESRLYIGTQNQGLYVWQEARIEHLSVGEGLPSPRVTGLVQLPESYSSFGLIGVATDFGVAGLNEYGSIQPFSALPNLTSLAVHDGRLFAGKFGGGAVEIGADATATMAASQRTGEPSATNGLPVAVPATLAALDDELWAFTPAGAFVLSERGSALFFDPVSSQLASASVLSSEHVTGLAIDGRGRLWIGYFDRGIDLIDPQSGDRLSHIEDGRVREINFLVYDRDQDRTLAATSMGLAVLDGRFRQSVLTREQNGLVHNSVAHVLLATRAGLGSPTPGSGGSGSGMYLVTAGGLTEYDGGRARSLTAFHGLASNHLYASAFRGSQLFVGSLAGLVELEGLRVVRTYKTSNSRLSHDWVSALASVNGVLFIGTNGGGVDQLLPTGEWINFSDELGRFEVNPNAMHLDGERLYVGTTDRGLLVYNTRERRWTRVSSGLSSQNVTAVVSDERFVYTGTINGLVRIEKRVIE